MSLLIDLAKVATALNALLLLGLGSVWLRNYLRLRSKHTVGLLMFAAMVLAENLFTLYYYILDPTLSGWFNSAVPDPAWRAMLLFQVLETLGLGFLAWITFD
jgi:hypothetical protein